MHGDMGHQGTKGETRPSVVQSFAVLGMARTAWLSGLQVFSSQWHQAGKPESFVLRKTR